MMTSFRFILASLRHYRRIHLAVAAGVAVATAVLTGALLVGDSVRGSLRDLTLQRLGRIDSALLSSHLFRAALADELAKDPAFSGSFEAAEPVLLVGGTLQSGSGQSLRRATQVSVIGCRDEFWSFGTGDPPASLRGNQILLTESLARELEVEAGNEVLLRIPVAKAIPSDSPLGEKSDTSRTQRLEVAAVLPPQGLARFGLVPSQHAPRNAFLPLETLQRLLDQPGKANAVLVAGRDVDSPASDDERELLQQTLRPTLEDYGLVVEQLASPIECVQIAAEQLVLPDAVVQAAERAFDGDKLQPIVTYLANTLRVGEGEAERRIPYSMITGVESTAELGPLLDHKAATAGRGALAESTPEPEPLVDPDGLPIRLAEDEIALNRWAADDLEASIGDTVTVTFYEPESTHGRLHEHEPPLSLRLAHIVELQTADGRPTPAADPKLTPDLPGVTDQQSIDQWDLPFELVETIRSEDEAYWDEHRTTPKAFVSLATAKRLWTSRWGTISLLRLPVDTSVDGSLQDVNPRLREARPQIGERLLAELDPAAMGMAFLPVKAQGLAAASGTTPFDGLFLGFSFFLIAAAVMLIALLFQLGVQQRTSEIGVLAAAGVGRKRIAALLSREGLVIAAFGATIGVAAGVLYAWLMITGLRTWWVDAIATPFLELHVTPRGLALGWIVGVAVSWLTIRWSTRRLVLLPATRLLAGQTEPAAISSRLETPPAAGELRSPDRPRARFKLWPFLRALLIASTVVLIIFGFTLDAEVQAGIFFGSGAAVLALALGELRHRLRAAGRTRPSRPVFTLSALSALNTARNPGRSTLTIGLVAAASFLILAIGAFRLDSSDAGTGGFALLATSDQPIHHDLNTPEGRFELGFSDEENERLEAWRIYSLRVAAGEDASCLNLYRPTQPRLLGVPEEFVHRGGFAWAATADVMAPPSAGDNPWTLLDADLGTDTAGRSIVPAVLDMTTAYYSLHLGGVGARLEIRDTADQPVTIEVVGLLKHSLLQGSAMVSEANFLRLFPDVGGYRFFMIEPVGEEAPGSPRGPGAPRVRQHASNSGERSSPAVESLDDADVARLLETRLSADGFDVVDARERLAGYLAVQNTYLSTFQSLGALGLLLGTVGLAVVQLRSVLERRRELALMRAGGYRRARLVRMVVGENAVLLLGGLLVGSMAAVVATLPQWATYDADVPWAALVAILLAIALVGLAAGGLAIRSVLRAPLLPALRGN